MTDWPDLLTEAAANTTAALETAADRDWGVPAAGLDWTGRETLSHLALGVVGYASLLIARPRDRYIGLFASIDSRAPIPVGLEGIRIAAALLATTVRATPPDARAFHSWGTSDPVGFAAMGVTEILMHGNDLARTFGLGWTPPAELCAPVLTRLFPEAPTGQDPSATLLWATGRGELPGETRRTQWAWDGRVRESV